MCNASQKKKAWRQTLDAKRKMSEGSIRRCLCFVSKACLTNITTTSATKNFRTMSLNLLEAFQDSWMDYLRFIKAYDILEDRAHQLLYLIFIYKSVRASEREGDLDICYITHVRSRCIDELFRLQMCKNRLSNEEPVLFRKIQNGCETSQQPAAICRCFSCQADLDTYDKMIEAVTQFQSLKEVVEMILECADILLDLDTDSIPPQNNYVHNYETT